MIEIRNLSVHYGRKTVVNNVSTTAQSGQFVALVGPNGSGKSSLLKALAGLIPFDGFTSLPIKRRDRARILSYLAQNSTAPEDRKVEDIISLGRTPFLGPLSQLNDADHHAIQTAAQDCATDAFFGETFGTLSGGEKMRVHLSRALATQAPLLLADEPTTALDPFYQISVMNILRQSADTGTTIIAALHDLKLAEKFADRIWVMHSGQLVADAPAKSALTGHILETVFRINSKGEIV